jgi:hypothetical protein
VTGTVTWRWRSGDTPVRKSEWGDDGIAQRDKEQETFMAVQPVPAGGPGARRSTPRLSVVEPAAAESRSAGALRLVHGAICVYAVASIALVATHRVGLTSEHALLLVLVAAGLVPRLRGLVRDWLPFLFVAVMFEDMGALQPLVAGGVHAAGPAAFERAILGANAAPWLQAHLGGLTGPAWWQFPLVAEYLAHFLTPLLAGGYLWWRHRSRFGAYVAAYMVVMATGFAIYLVFPEMPPWLAAQHGIIAPVQRDVVAALDHLGPIGRVYSGADPFPDGAMPSLHVAVPTVIALSLLARARGRARWLWLLYPLTAGFAVVALGEHYMADAVVGLALGAAAWSVVEVAPALGALVNRRRRRPTAVVPGACWKHS